MRYGFCVAALVASFFLVSLSLSAPSRVSAEARHAQNLCTGDCPGDPDPTPEPDPTPIRISPGSGVSANGYNYHTEFGWYTNFLNLYAQVNDSGIATDPSDHLNFLTNEIWRNDANPTYWEEIGYTGGYLGYNYFQGLFGAYYQAATGYVEFAITTSPQPLVAGQYGAAVALAVTLDNSNYIDFNYNNDTYLDLLTAGSPAYVGIIGMESNSSTPQFNSFSGEIDIVGPQVFYSGASNWTYFPPDPGSLIYSGDAPGNSAYCGWITADPRYSPNEPHPACFHD